MNKSLRKLQQISGSLFISLPKAWINKLKLKKNSEVEIGFCNDGSLRLSPKLKQEVVGKEVTLEASRYVARDVVKKGLVGTEKIVILSKKPISKLIRKDIKWFVERIPTTEIIEEDETRIVIQNFGFKSIPTKKAINRLLYLVSDMFSNLRSNSINELKNNFENLRRFYFIIVTHIRTYLKTGLYASEDNGFTPLEAMDYRMFCEKIERIGLILRDFKYDKILNSLFNKVESLFNDTKKAFLKKDEKRACEVWFKRDELIKEAKDLIKKTRNNQVRELMRVIEYCKDMADLI